MVFGAVKDSSDQEPGPTPLQIVAAASDLKAVKKLLATEADINAPAIWYYGFTAL